MSISTRLSLTLLLLLLGFGTAVALLARGAARQHEAEVLQHVSRGLAQHIVGHWPEVATPVTSTSERAAREAVLKMLMVVNPGVQVYLLDANGHVDDYLGEPGMVRQHQVDLAAVQRFLAGAALPLRGTDPMGGDAQRLFSAAMFPPRPGMDRPPGYLYVVLDGAARQQASAQGSPRAAWQGLAWAAALGALLTALAGWMVFRRLTQPLRRLAHRMSLYAARPGLPKAAPADPSSTANRQPSAGQPSAGQPLAGLPKDEVQAIDQAYGAMTRRIELQAETERRQAAEHRESLAGVAHDLRSPLTALHGHLEALSQPAFDAPAERAALLHKALGQSNRVRRLSQQLFELAALQASDALPQRERFNLDELVTDTVQKFERQGDAAADVVLASPPPGRLPLEGDWQLIERALTNLIDNALRHAGSARPISVLLQQAGNQAQLLVEDAGPGLPTELAQRLMDGQSLRQPPIQRAQGGIGGLGLAIAQRVAQLHGGSLKPWPTPGGGTRLCLALPLAEP